MHIGIVTHAYPPHIRGGGQVSTQLLAENLVLNSRINQVTVFSFDGNKKEEISGVSIHRPGQAPHQMIELQNINAFFRYLQKPQLRQEIGNVDLLHGYNMSLNPFVGVISEYTGIPSVATLNSYLIYPKSEYNVSPDAMRLIYEKTIMKTAGKFVKHYTKSIDKYITLSTDSKRFFVDKGFNSEHISVIPNMIDQNFQPTTQNRAESPFKILYVGNLSKAKGVDYLIKSLLYTPSDIRLHIVGSAADTRVKYLKRLADKIGVDNQIEFAGNIPYESVMNCYAKADLFAHPGIWPEPFGRTILEAMQSGLPVVATNLGGPKDVIQNEKLLCEPQDPESLAKSIKFVRNSETDIGNINKKYVEKNYSPDKIIPEIIDVYRRTI